MITRRSFFVGLAKAIIAGPSTIQILKGAGRRWRSNDAGLIVPQWTTTDTERFYRLPYEIVKLSFSPPGITYLLPSFQDFLTGRSPVLNQPDK